MPRDRPRLWDSFKRVLGTPPREDEREPPAEQPSTDSLPFLAPDDTPGAPDGPGSAPVRAKAEPARPRPEPVVESVAILAEPPDELATPGSAPEAGSPPSPRLARGLASFSRDNADREKKFRHILSDGAADASKKD